MNTEEEIEEKSIEARNWIDQNASEKVEYPCLSALFHPPQR